MEIEIISYMTHLTLHVLGVVFPVNITRRSICLQSQGRIPHLSRKAVFEIQKTRLAHVLDFSTGLANDGGFESRS